VHSATQATRQNNTPAALDGIVGLIQCEGPNANLTNFVGNLKVFNQPDENGRSSSRSKTNTVALGQENVALRGAKLKNTEFMYGCAIYTGEDTKMSRNSRMTTNKFSTAEITMNKYLIFFMILLFLEVRIISSLKCIATYIVSS
jgi:phospholipid-translocating ATPase